MKIHRRSYYNVVLIAFYFAAIVLLCCLPGRAEKAFLANAPESIDSTAAKTSAKNNPSIESGIIGEKRPDADFIKSSMSHSDGGSVTVPARLNSQVNSPPEVVAANVSPASGDFENHNLSLSPGSKGIKKYEKAGSGNISVWKTLFALVVVLGLILFSAWLFRRFALGSKRLGGTGGIEIISRSPVSPRQSLCLVKLGSRLLLVGLSPNHMVSLCSIDDPDEISGMMGLLEKNVPQSISNTFTRLFHRESDNYSDNDLNVMETPVKNRQWHAARSELTMLLDRVKGLTRMRFRDPEYK